MRLFAVLVSVLLLGLCSCTTQSAQRREVPHRLAAMDSEDNPYRNQYGEWDFWIHENARMDPDWNYQLEPDEYTQLQSMMDESGFLIPVIELKRRSLQARLEGRKPDYSLFHPVPAAGQADPEMLEGLSAAKFALMADYYPEVPAWLAMKFPDESVADKFFLPPNGDVMVRVAGHAQDSSGSEPNPCHSNPCSSTGTSPSGFHWERYDSNGNLIFKTNSEQWWAAYYLPEHPLEAELPLADIHVRKDGFALVTTAGITKAYDYDATLIGDQLPAERSDLPFTLLSIAGAEQLRLAQQN